LLRAYEIDVAYTQFPLHPETPPEGIALRDLFAGRGFDLEAMAARMKGLMDAEGLPYARSDRTYNSRLAQELAKLAEQEGREGIHDALFHAYFVDGKNLADVEALVAVAEGVGLPAEGTRRAMEQRTFRSAVDADWTRARAIGVTGVPTFVAGGQGMVGAQPYEALEKLVQRAGARRR
jgi:predicted DsbA family dithiol-disulfide isomerase